MSASAVMASAEARKTVLVVDDAPENLRLVNEILHNDYRILVATNGRKALELANAAPGPDLILLDVVMPGMDGYEVCARLKTESATKDIPVIFLTAQTEIEDETRGFETGAVDYIHKPFSPAVVVARVQTHLALRAARQRLARQLQDLRDELETARKIQMSILPREAPTIDGLDIAARYIPMTAVAGDFYDFFAVDDHRLGVLVADVSGHGMPAALIASMLKIAFAAQSASASSPAAVITGLNKALCGKFQGHFVTAAYALIDTEARTLKYAGAGHPPLIIREAQSGSARTMTENGLFLGFLPRAEYTEIEAPFLEGDVVVLYTDGIPEATKYAGSEDDFGEDRLKQSLEKTGGQSAGRVVDSVLQDVAAWTGGKEPEDDTTIVAVRFAS